jgi:2-polyprenyl-3-methyl-5-hydroxy-6-metoxy-1,4-benzoquinol methylase
VAENVRCNLCNGNDLRQKLIARDEFWMIGEKFNIVQCRSCNLAFLNPRPSQEEITNYYPAEYYVDAKEWNIQRNNVKELQNRLDYIIKYCGSKCPGKLLDIGIFNGAFVAHALRLGWDAYGLDSSRSAISLAKKSVPQERLFHGYVESSPFPPNSFDVVTMWEVLEHTMNPLNVLKTVHKLNSPNGILVISVPNFSSIESRIFGKYWNGLDVPRHLYHFIPDTLDKMLQKANFKKVFLKTINAGHILEFADPITYGRESLRNVLINFGLYPERKGISGQQQGKIHRNENRYRNRQHWKKSLFGAVEIPLLKTIDFISAASDLNNTIIIVARKA